MPIYLTYDNYIIMPVYLNHEAKVQEWLIHRERLNLNEGLNLTSPMIRITMQ